MNSVTRSTFDEVMVPCYAPMPMIPVKGKGSRLWDQDGAEYIDFAGGIAVSCLGHCHPIMVDALTEQANKLWHASNIMTNEPALQLAQKLVELSFADKAFFANSGAEANEAALKLARRWALETHGEHKTEIIAFTQGFHGRTFFTVSVGGQASYSDGFGAKPGNITHLPYNDIDALKAAISDKTCAVMMEPIQGEGGVISSSKEFMQSVRDLCDQHQALLIFDEVQTGNGRTGDFYAYQGFGVEPDILATAKSLGGGFPIGAMLTKADIAKHMKPGVHGTTYGGNPLACAVAKAVIGFTSQQVILNGVKQREQWFHQGLEAINQEFDLFNEVRGQGLLIGAELKGKWQDKASDIMKAASEQGLLMLVAGKNVIRFTPSLVIEQIDIEEGLARLKQAIKQMNQV